MTRYLALALMGSFTLSSMLLMSPDEPAGGSGDPPAGGDGATQQVGGTTILTAPIVAKEPVKEEAAGGDKVEPTAEEKAAAEAAAAKAKEGDDKGDKDKKEEAANEFLGWSDDIDIKTPEGFEVDDEIKGEFMTAAKEIGLSQKGAERLVGIQTKLQERQAAATAKLIEGWAKDVKADKEIGGKDYDANTAAGRQFLADFGNEQVAVLLDKTGLGNHPEVVRMFVRAGKAMGEARAEKGDKSAGKTDKATEISNTLYGDK